MAETTRERFHKIARFQRLGELFVGSCFNTGYWLETVERWRLEGVPEKILPAPGAVLGGTTPGLNRYFQFDQIETMEEVISGHSHLEEYKVEPSMAVLERVSAVPIVPLFEYEIIAQDERTRTVRTPSGAVMKMMKTDKYRGVMPQYLERPVTDRASWERYKRRLDPHTPERWPTDWKAYAQQCNQRDYPLGLKIGSLLGYLRECMGLEKLLFTFYDDPGLIEDMMDHMLYFSTEVAKRVLKDIKPDWVFIWEDMAYKSGPMVSPKMFRKFMMPRYRKLTDLLRSNGVDVILVDCDGDVNQLIPLWIECGINACWPLEVAAGNNAVEIRKKYGTDIILFGNLDKREVAKGKSAIREEVMTKVPFLLEKGGYFPCLDHVVPPDISWENYCYFIDTLREAGGLQRLFNK